MLCSRSSEQRFRGRCYDSPFGSGYPWKRHCCHYHRRLSPSRYSAGSIDFFNNVDLVYTIFAGMIVSNFLLIGGGYLGVKLFVHALRIPKSILYPTIVLLTILGSYAARNDLTTVWIMRIFGVIGYFMRKYNYPAAPLVLGLILGPICERNLITSLIGSQFNFLVFIQRPASLILLIISLLFFFIPIIKIYYLDRSSRNIFGMKQWPADLSDDSVYRHFVHSPV